MRQIEGGKGTGGAEVVGIAGIGNTGCLVKRLAVGVADQERQVLSGVAKTELQRVVTGIADAGVVIIVAERGSQCRAGPVDRLPSGCDVGSLFAKGAAGGRSRGDLARLAERQTQSGIAGVRRIDQQQMMRLGKITLTQPMAFTT